MCIIYNNLTMCKESLKANVLDLYQHGNTFLTPHCIIMIILIIIIIIIIIIFSWLLVIFPRFCQMHAGYNGGYWALHNSYVPVCVLYWLLGTWGPVSFWHTHGKRCFLSHDADDASMRPLHSLCWDNCFRDLHNLWCTCRCRYLILFCMQLLL